MFRNEIRTCLRYLLLCTCDFYRVLAMRRGTETSWNGR